MAADNPIDPIHQFEISKIAEMQIAGIDISFTKMLLNYYTAQTKKIFLLWKNFYFRIKKSGLLQNKVTEC